jgi:hypothetical protein
MGEWVMAESVIAIARRSAPGAFIAQDLHHSVIQRKISHGVQSASGAIFRSCLPTVSTTLRQQGRDVGQFLEQAWISHNRGDLKPTLLPEP